MRAYIKPNYDDDGNLVMGLFRKRNLIDVGVYLGLIYILIQFLSPFISVIAQMTIGFLLSLMGGVLLLFGFDGEAISVVIYRFLRYKKKKGIFLLKMPIKIK